MYALYMRFVLWFWYDGLCIIDDVWWLSNLKCNIMWYGFTRGILGMSFCVYIPHYTMQTHIIFGRNSHIQIDMHINLLWGFDKLGNLTPVRYALAASCPAFIVLYFIWLCKNHSSMKSRNALEKTLWCDVKFWYYVMLRFGIWHLLPQSICGPIMD